MGLIPVPGPIEAVEAGVEIGVGLLATAIRLLLGWIVLVSSTVAAAIGVEGVVGLLVVAVIARAALWYRAID